MLAIDMTLFGKIIEVYRTAGLIKSAMTAEELCDPTFVDSALKA